MEARVAILQLLAQQAAMREGYLRGEFERVSSMADHGAASPEELARASYLYRSATYDTQIVQAMIQVASIGG